MSNLPVFVKIVLVFLLIAVTLICGVAMDQRRELSDYRETYRRVIDEKCAKDEKHCTCVPALRARITELENEIKNGNR